MGNSCCQGNKADTESPSKVNNEIESVPNGTHSNFPKKVESSEEKYKLNQNPKNNPAPARATYSPMQSSNHHTNPQKDTGHFNSGSIQEDPTPIHRTPEQCLEKNGKYNLELAFSNSNPELIHQIPAGTFTSLEGVGISTENRCIQVASEGQLHQWDVFSRSVTGKQKLGDQGAPCQARISGSNVIMTVQSKGGQRICELKNLQGKTLLNHSYSAGVLDSRCIRISPIGKQGIVVSELGQLYILDLDSKKVHECGKNLDLYSADYSSELKLAAASNVDKLFLFKVEKGDKLKQVLEVDYMQTLTKSTNTTFQSSVWSLIFVNDLLLTGHTNGSIVCWKLDVGGKNKLEYQFQLEAAHPSEVLGLYGLQNTSNVIISHDSSDLKIWELNSKKCLKSFSSTKKIITQVALSQDERYLITSYQTGEIKIWNVGFFIENQQLIQQGHFLSNQISSVPDIFLTIFKIDDTKDSLFEALVCVTEHSNFTPQGKRDLMNRLRKNVLERINKNKDLINGNSDALKKGIESQSTNEWVEQLATVFSDIYQTEIVVLGGGSGGSNSSKTAANKKVFVSKKTKAKARAFLIELPNKHYDCMIGRLDMQEFSQFVIGDNEVVKRLEFIVECVF